MSGTVTIEKEPALSPSIPEVESDELSAAELASLEAYRLNTIPTAGNPPEVVEKTAEGEKKVETRPAEKADPDEVTLQNGELVDSSGKKVSKVVPHGALHSEREGHKATKKELQETKTQLGLIMELLQKNGLPAGKVPEKTPEAASDPLSEPDININDDFLGAMAQMQRRQNAMTKKQLEQASASEATNQFKTVLSTYSADAARARQEDPAWNDAYTFYETQVRARYEALGVSGEDLNKAVQLDELNVVRSAIARRMSPADTIKKLAIAGGYSPKAPEPKPNGKAPNPAAVEQIRQISNGQAQHQSLSDMAGQAGEGLTGAKVANMSEAEFDRLYDKLEREDPKQLERLLNGTYRG